VKLGARGDRADVSRLEEVDLEQFLYIAAGSDHNFDSRSYARDKKPEENRHNVFNYRFHIVPFYPNMVTLTNFVFLVGLIAICMLSAFITYGAEDGPPVDIFPKYVPDWASPTVITGE
jgi:hypothetical protein